VEQRSIYADDRDRVHFLHVLEKVIDDYRWQLLAYVLMSNHYHLLFRTPEPNLSRGMKDLDGDYASFFNIRHQRAGHLFQGRFKSHLVDGETYLVSLARYIVLNPVRACMVETPGEWQWSSYRATAGLAAIPRWLDPAPILDVFNADDWTAAMHGYRELVAAAIGSDASPWENLAAGMFLGGTKFLQEVEAKIRERKSSDEYPRGQRMFRATAIESIREAVRSIDGSGNWPPSSGSDARAVFVLLASRLTTTSNAGIGRMLGITGQGVGPLIRASEARLRTDDAFAAFANGVRSKVERDDDST
jgi:REP element-mobilizing transposase RayT